MAGIGFALERLTTGRSLSGIVGAYGHAGFLVAGPWVFMAIAIAASSAAFCPAQVCLAAETFRSTLIYVFLISYVAAGAVALPITRFVSDRIYARDPKGVLGAYAAAAAIYAALAGPAALLFFGLAVDLPGPAEWAAIQGVLLMGAAWLTAPFLGVVKDHRAIAAAFLAGAAVIAASGWLAPRADLTTLLFAVNAGFALIVAMTVARLAALNGGDFADLRSVPAAFARYWELAVFGAAIALGAWIDKIIVWWFGPQEARLVIAHGLVTFPPYDSAMFWAQLATIPLLVGFFVHVETGFYRRHRAFYAALDTQASARALAARLDALSAETLSGVLRLFGAACLVAAAAILALFALIDHLPATFGGLGLMRAAIVGAALYACALFALLLLLYFDLRRIAAGLACLFLAVNAAGTALLLPLGFAYLGYGFLGAGALVFALAAAALARETPWLARHALQATAAAAARADRV